MYSDSQLEEDGVVGYQKLAEDVGPLKELRDELCA
jgi:hypothetical protein